MYIKEIRQPGTQLAPPYDSSRCNVAVLVSVVLGHLADACLNLTMLEAKPPWRPEPDWQTMVDEDLEMTARLRQGVEFEMYPGGLLCFPAKDPVGYRAARSEVEFETARRRLRERAALGVPPMAFRNRLVFIYARAFIYAADGIAKALKALADQENVPAAREMLDQLTNMLPDLIEVRNTSHHVEDRARGIGKPTRGKPVVVAETGIQIDNLLGCRFECTLADGTVGALDITEATLDILADAVRGLVDRLPWTGPPHLWPY